MRRGRPLEINNTNKRKASERKIIEALEESQDTFSDLLKRVDITKGTLSKGLKDLEDENVIERYYKDGKVLIRLSLEEASPVNTTLRHLDRLTERNLLNLGKIKELLSADVVDWILEVGTYRWSEKRKRIESEQEKLEADQHERKAARKRLSESLDIELSEEREKRTLNELLLLRSLARYSLERSLITRGLSETEYKNNFKVAITCRGYDVGPSIIDSNFQSRLQSGLFPTVKSAFEQDIVDNIDELLIEISPLLEPSWLEEDPKESFQEKFGLDSDFQDFQMYGISATAQNLAAAVLRDEIEKYNELLPKLWEEKRRR